MQLAINQVKLNRIRIDLDLLLIMFKLGSASFFTII